MSSLRRWIPSSIASLAVGLLAVGFAGSAAAALTCNITAPSGNVTIQAGGTVSYTGTVSGGKANYTYSWTFQGGTPGTSSTTSRSTSNSVTGVVYSTPGVYTTTLAISDSSKPTAQTCSSNPTRTVTVTSGTDTVPPTVSSLSASPAGPTYTTAQTVTLTAIASDNVGVTKVEFYDNGTLKATDTASPYTFAWAITSADNGTHNWTAKAYDAAGNTGTSTTLTLTVSIGVPPPPNVSINSTSQSCGGSGQPACINTAVTQQPAPGTGGSGNVSYHVLAVNDLGMHCGDLDTRISSILPPFNVLRAVVVQQPPSGAAPIRNPAGVSVSFSAAANPSDPALSTTPTRVPATGGVYKTNFWDIAQGAYDPFYPGTSTGLNPFAPPYNLALPPDQSLPMPDAERFYLGDGQLAFNQQPMPGLGSPYALNIVRPFALQVTNQPFFKNFAFGYTATVNWWTAEGVPITPVDDFGRQNAYPMVRVQAVDSSNNTLATTDTVIPVSGEASCQSCHAAASDAQSVDVLPPGGDPANYGVATRNLSAVEFAISDPKLNQVPLAVSVEWASDHNILKLHDNLNGTTLITGTTEDFPNPGTNAFKPVVCQVCHYTPALDLAQLGPLSGATGTLANGRQQTNNQSMSRVMHNHHGQLTSLFPAMPAPTQDANGVITNQTARLSVLNETCYMCHPGKNTKCLRGAMANGGMLCQDCHGDMPQVGNDFSKNMPGGSFILANDFYTPSSTTPRVPWANEPSCGSCHTGDFAPAGVVDTRFGPGGNLAGTSGTITNTKDPAGNTDGIRLLQAYLSTDTTKKTPIIPPNKRFAEDTVPGTPGNGTLGSQNPKLYRVSASHHGATTAGDSGAGIFCEACHGATHAEWPNGNPLANDNVTANQLQGHTGVISECSVCHGTSLNNLSTLDGPHGLHPIGASAPFANSSIHRQQFTNSSYNDTDYHNKCQACHGGTSRRTSQGTVLSRTQGPRTLRGQNVAAGTPIGCSLCHNN